MVCKQFGPNGQSKSISYLARSASPHPQWTLITAPKPTKMKSPDRYLLACVVKVIAGTPVDESFRQIVPLLGPTVTSSSNAAVSPFSAGRLSDSRPMVALPPSTSNDPLSHPEDFLMPTRSVDSVPLKLSDDTPIDRVSTLINTNDDYRPGLVHNDPLMEIVYAAINFQHEHLPRPQTLEKNDFVASSTSSADFGLRWQDNIIPQNAKTFPEGCVQHPSSSTVLAGTQTPELRGSHQRNFNPFEDGQHFKFWGSPGFDREVRLTPEKRKDMSSSSKAGMMAWPRDPNIHGTIDSRRPSTNFNKLHSTQLPPYEKLNQNGSSPTHEIKVLPTEFLKMSPQAFHGISDRISPVQDVLPEGKDPINYYSQSNEISRAYGKSLLPRRAKSLFERLIFDDQAFQNEEFSKVHGQNRLEAISNWLELLRDANQNHHNQRLVNSLRFGFAHWKKGCEPKSRTPSEQRLHVSARAMMSIRSSEALWRYKFQWLRYWSILTGEDLEMECRTGIRPVTGCRILIAFLFRVDMLATFTARLNLKAQDDMNVLKEALHSFRKNERTFTDDFEFDPKRTILRRQKTYSKGRPKVFYSRSLNRFAWECFEYWVKNCERTYLQDLCLNQGGLRLHFKGAINDLTDFSADIMNVYIGELFPNFK